MSLNIGIRPNWQSGSINAVPALRQNELHIWWLPLSINTEQTHEAQQLLNDIQRDKLARRKNQQLKSAYLAGRYYLFKLLAGYMKVPANEILLNYSRLNKPFISDSAANLHFNFTDTIVKQQSHGVFAFSHNDEVGVDIEARSRRSNFELIAERRFTENEKAFVTENGEVNPDKFLAVWTRKEAFGKATGRGINFQMNEQDLASDDKTELDFFDLEQRAWRLLQLELGDDLIACVVHAGHQPLSLKTFNFSNEKNPSAG